MIAPAYPGFEVEVEALNRDPSPIQSVTIDQIRDKLEAIVRDLDSPPILMGHSAGGVFVQLLLDRGYEAAGVAINSAPTEGVNVLPLSQIKAAFPVLKNPANRHRTVALTPDEWRYAFTNTFSEEESLALYKRYAMPASGPIFFESALANLIPGHQGTWVDYNNDARAPLLFISGAEDHLMPPSVQRSNAKHYKSRTITEIKEFEGRAHLMPGSRAGRRWQTTRWSGPLGTRRDRPSPAAKEVCRYSPNAYRWADDADRGRSVASAHRSDIRRTWPKVLFRLGLRLSQSRGARRGGSGYWSDRRRSTDSRSSCR